MKHKHIFNQIRVVQVNEMICIQKKFLFKWKFLPDTPHWEDWESLRWKYKYRFKTKDEQKAIDEANKYSAMFHPKDEVEIIEIIA